MTGLGCLHQQIPFNIVKHQEHNITEGSGTHAVELRHEAIGRRGEWFERYMSVLEVPPLLS